MHRNEKRTNGNSTNQGLGVHISKQTYSTEFMMSNSCLRVLQGVSHESCTIFNTPSIDHLLYEENAGAQLTMESSSND